MTQHDDLFFPYRFDQRYVGMWWPLGVRDGVDGVTISDTHMTASFGRARVDTPLANIAEAHITRDYHWWKAIGMRLSFADDGLTFGTSTHGGVCIHFEERVDRVIGFQDHSALTVTVDDLTGLVQALTAADERDT